MLKNPYLADFGFDNGGFSAKLTAELANHYLLREGGGGLLLHPTLFLRGG